MLDNWSVVGVITSVVVLAATPVVIVVVQTFLESPESVLANVPPKPVRPRKEEEDDDDKKKAKAPSALQRRAAAIAESYTVQEDFHPWLTNRHVQTMGGHLLQEYCLYLPAQGTWSAFFQRLVRFWKENKKRGEDPWKDFWDVREKVQTVDGDWFHADLKFVNRKAAAKYMQDHFPSSKGTTVVLEPDESNNKSVVEKQLRDMKKALLNSAPTVIMCHGLEASSHSGFSVDMCTAFNQAGMNCICLNYRGCSGIPNDKLGGYHFGFTEDLKYYVKTLKEELFKDMTTPEQRPRFYVAGFSLGANVVLKCLGELGESALRDYHIYGGAVANAPLDQEFNQLKLAEPGVNRFVYTNNLLGSLVQKATEKMQRFSVPPITNRKPPKTILEFDDMYMAPAFGFKDCWDYYRQTSSIHFLQGIAVPTMVLNAADDPFFDNTIWPVEKVVSRGGSAPLKMVQAAHGGHLGFFTHLVDDPKDERLQPLYVAQEENEEERVPKAPPGWATSQLAQFLKHVNVHAETKRLESDLLIQK